MAENHDEKKEEVNTTKEKLPFNVSMESAISFLKTINDGEAIQFSFSGDDESQIIFEEKSNAIIGMLGNEEGNIIHIHLDCEKPKEFKTMCSLLCIALNIEVEDVDECYKNIGMYDLQNLGESIDDTKLYVSKGIKYQLSHLDGMYNFWIYRDYDTKDQYEK